MKPFDYLAALAVFCIAFVLGFGCANTALKHSSPPVPATNFVRWPDDIPHLPGTSTNDPIYQLGK